MVYCRILTFLTADVLLLCSIKTIVSSVSIAVTAEFTEENCLFCSKVTTNDSNIAIEPRNDNFIVIKDINPVATHHYLVLSREHIPNFEYLKRSRQDCDLLKDMTAAAKRVLLKHGGALNESRFGFHSPPFSSVPHLHLHAISPVSSMSVINRFFGFNSYLGIFFVDVDYVEKSLECNNTGEVEK